jgi:hypothetical protein
VWVNEIIFGYSENDKTNSDSSTVKFVYSVGFVAQISGVVPLVE